MKNLWKEKILRGERTVGMFVNTGNESTIEVAAMSDMDYVIIDTEHGPFDVESTAAMIRVMELHQNTTLVRVKDSNRNSILKMLDVGAKGLIIPQVHSVEQVKEIIAYGKYFPLGERGFAFARGAGYGHADHAKLGMAGYMETCNRECLLIPQCETLGALEHIETIAAMEGVDGIFIGPFDLSIAMGIPGQFDAPEFRAALARIKAACDQAGKFCMVYCKNVDFARERLKEGFLHPTVSCDYTYYFNALNKAVAEILA